LFISDFVEMLAVFNYMSIKPHQPPGVSIADRGTKSIKLDIVSSDKYLKAEVEILCGNQWITAGSTEGPQCVFIGLHPNTRYCYRARIQAEDGSWSSYSRQEKFMTLAGITLAFLSNNF
jgi:hypothetical protein